MKDSKRKKILERFARMKKLENKPVEDLTPEEYGLMYPTLAM